MIRLQLAALLTLVCLAVLAATGRLAFLAREFPDRRRRLAAAALLFAVLITCIFYPTVTADESREIDPEQLSFFALFLGHALLASFLLAWWRLQREESLVRLLRLDHLAINDVPLGLAAGAVGWIATIVVTGMVGGLWSLVGPSPEPDTAPRMMSWLAHLVIWRKLNIIALAMTVEEAFFRGFLQPRIGWGASSLLFAIAHASYGLPLMVISVLVISLVIGWAFERTGRLLPCIVAHGFFDGVQLLVVIPMALQMIENGAPLPIPAWL